MVVVEVVIGADDVDVAEVLDVEVGCCVVGVVPVAEVVGGVGFDGVDVMVVVRGGNVARVKPDVVVVAKGPPNVVVVTSPPTVSGTVVPKKPGNAAPSSSPPSPPEGAIAPISPVDADDLPWNQLMPMVTAKARPPARATMTRPEMSRPTMTLLRSEKERPCFSGPTVARCSAICLARSSGLNLSRPFGPRPLGGGNRVSLLSLSPALRSQDDENPHVNVMEEARRGSCTTPGLLPPCDPGRPVGKRPGRVPTDPSASPTRAHPNSVADRRTDLPAKRRTALGRAALLEPERIRTGSGSCYPGFGLLLFVFVADVDGAAQRGQPLGRVLGQSVVLTRTGATFAQEAEAGNCGGARK